jgi:hypothetical protein
MDSNNLYEQSLNVNNKELSQRYNQASQSAAAASMIKSYAEKNGDDWSDLNTPQEILSMILTLIQSSRLLVVSSQHLQLQPIQML